MCEVTKGSDLFLSSGCEIKMDENEGQEILNAILADEDLNALATLNLSKLTVALRLYYYNQIIAKEVLDDLEGAIS